MDWEQAKKIAEDEAQKQAKVFPWGEEIIRELTRQKVVSVFGAEVDKMVKEVVDGVMGLGPPATRGGRPGAHLDLNHSRDRVRGPGE